MPNFMEVLNKKAVDVEKPKPKPIGTYLAAIQGMPKQKTVTAQGEEKGVISFPCKALMARDDVDQEELAAYPGEVSDWPPFNRDFWIDTPEGEWALRQFLIQTLEINPGEGKSSKSFGEMLAESAGKQLLITLKHRPYTNRDNQLEIATEIAACAKV